MSGAQIWDMTISVLTGLGASTVFILALFIGFCILVGLTKLKATSGGAAVVIKSLDERISHQPMQYMRPDAPHGPADQLRAPELLERPAPARA